MKPHDALQRLQKLTGQWMLTGRSLHADEDDISGTATFEWILGGFYLLYRSQMNMQSQGFDIQSWAIIGYDPDTDLFPELVYTNMGSAPLSYTWQIKGDEATHWTEGSKYTGRFSEDGTILDGGWRADGVETTVANTYDATMTKVAGQDHISPLDQVLTNIKEEDQ